MEPPVGPPAPGEAAPTALRAPALAGPGVIGETLIADPGEWRGAQGFGFAWLRDGAPVAGAAGASYAPTAADDGAALAFRVAAFGPGGTTEATTPAITIAFPPPVAVGRIPDLLYTPDAEPHVMDLSPFFAGASLRFSVTGAGVTVDPASGAVTLDFARFVEGGVVTVAAANSGGRAELDFALRLATLPAVVAAPALSGADAAGSVAVGAALSVDPGVWSGRPAPTLALQWLADGAPIEGATAAAFTPGAAQAGVAISCRVSATNLAGTVAAETPAATVAHGAPVVAGALADVFLARGTGPQALALAAAFAGEALVFSIEGAGATIDPATGVATIPTGAALAAAEVIVRAANSGGVAEARFAVSVLAAPEALAAPAPAAFARGAGARTVATAAAFAGDALVYALDAAPAGVSIDAATGVVTVPTAAALAGEVVVRASNPVGAATQLFAVTVLAAPEALAAPAAAVFLQGTGTRTISAQAFFAGEDLAYALDAAPSGVTINAGSGLVSVPTAAALAGEVVVRAVNAMGAATQRVAVAVRASRTVFDTAAALDEVRYSHLTLAPGWVHDAAGGFARLTPGRDDRAQGDWIHAGADGRGGDGRYRVLARWSAGASAPTQARPFGFIGRVSGTGDDFRAVRIDVLLQSGVRSLQLREYATAGGGARTLATVATAWAWDAWQWIEVEFEGRAVRARLYPEAETPAGWTSAVSVNLVAPGAFGPMSFSVSGQVPAVDIRQIEFQPLAETVPAAAQATDWTAGQMSVQS